MFRKQQKNYRGLFIPASSGYFETSNQLSKKQCILDGQLGANWSTREMHIGRGGNYNACWPWRCKVNTNCLIVHVKHNSNKTKHNKFIKMNIISK